MKIRKKPEKPERLKTPHRKELEIWWSWNSYTVQDLIDICIRYNMKPQDVRIEEDYSGNELSVFLEWKEDEPEEEFQERLNDYERKLERYNKWYEENKEEIEATLAARKKKKEGKKKRKIIREIKFLEKELDRRTSEYCKRCGSPLIPGGLHACD